MAVTVDSFLTHHPEFRPAEVSLIQAKISDAVLRVDASIWGTKTDNGVRLLAAHTLALSPFGQNAKLVSKEGQTTYGQQYAQARKEVVVPFAVI